jgi:hypothetical protein
MKKLTILLSVLCIPAVAWAHNPGGYVMSLGVSFFLALIISLVLLKRIAKNVGISNKFIRYIVLFMIEIVLLLFLTIILGYTLGGLLYIYIFESMSF